jgi:hypothetical protein
LVKALTGRKLAGGKPGGAPIDAADNVVNAVGTAKAENVAVSQVERRNKATPRIENVVAVCQVERRNKASNATIIIENVRGSEVQLIKKIVH